MLDLHREPWPAPFQRSVSYLIPRASRFHHPPQHFLSSFLSKEIPVSTVTLISTPAFSQHLTASYNSTLYSRGCSFIRRGRKGREVSSYMLCHGGGRGVKPQGLEKPSVLSEVRGFGYCIMMKLPCISSHNSHLTHKYSQKYKCLVQVAGLFITILGSWLSLKIHLLTVH